MPIVKPAASETMLPPRKAKVLHEVDVLVVGGGPSGVAAALGAACAGAKVLLVEQYGFLGGSATAGLVLTMASYYTSSNVPLKKAKGLTLFPVDHGAGEPVIGGVMAKLVERLVAAGGAFAPSTWTGYMVPFDPEILKGVLLDMLDEAGVELLFHAFASGVMTEDVNLRGVVFETKSGPLVAKAKVVVDCTGDGDIAALAGAPYEVGRGQDRMVQPMTLMFMLEGFRFKKFNEYVKLHPDQWHGVEGLPKLLQQATRDGELRVPRECALIFGNVHPGHVLVNSTRILDTLGTDVWDLTRAEIEGRRQVAQLTRFFRKYVPGFEQAFVHQSGIYACVRESRRIMGCYMLTAKDVLEAKKFDDAVARGSYPIDLHNPRGKGTLLKKIKGGEAYDIPLRCLVPQKIDGLLVGGRCISGTHAANASYRVMPVCVATGQAAGVCAAVAVKNRQLPRDVKASEVQAELLKQGAILHANK